MRCASGLGMRRHLDDARHDLSFEGRDPSRPIRIPLDTGKSADRKTFTPPANLDRIDPDLFGDFEIIETVGSEQHDARSFDQAS